MNGDYLALFAGHTLPPALLGWFVGDYIAEKTYAAKVPSSFLNLLVSFIVAWLFAWVGLVVGSAAEVKLVGSSANLFGQNSIGYATLSAMLGTWSVLIFQRFRLRSSVLMLACANGNIAQVSKLLTNGAQVDFRDKQGRTALVYAVINYQPEIIELLLAHGAEGSAEATELLRARRELSALMKACANGNIDLTQELINKGADVNYQDKQDGTALLYAVLNDQPLIVELLLKNGADMNLQSIRGKTAIDVARSRGSAKIVEMLENAQQRETLKTTAT